VLASLLDSRSVTLNLNKETKKSKNNIVNKILWRVIRV